MAELVVAAWRPSTEAAGAEPAVEMRLKYYGKRIVGGFAGTLFSLLLALSLMTTLHRVDALVVVFLAAAAVQLVALARFLVTFGGWLPTAKALVRDLPAQRVPARIVSHQRNSAVLAIDGGRQHLRLRPATWAVRQVITRTGEISLIGPDTDGTAVVFADSQAAPLPAKVVTAPTPTEPEPLADINAAPQWYAARHTRTLLAPFVGTVVTAAALAYDLSGTLFAEQGWVLAVILVVMSALRLLGNSAQFRLGALLKAGEWHSYPVTLTGWTGNPRPVGELTLRLTLPDGYELPVVVKQANADLVANVVATGTLWVAGEARRNTLVAVGLPGYPVAATARFTVGTAARFPMRERI